MEPKWLELARAEVGTKEVPGAASNKKVLAYFADAGHPEVKSDATAWCAGFVGAMLKRAGLPNTGSLAARSYLNYGTELDDPREGCIVVFARGNSTWEGHVAFYVGETDKGIKVLGGNQADAVNISTYSKAKLLGYRWPIEPTVEALRDAGSSDIATVDKIKTGIKVGIGVTGGTAAADKTGAMEQLKDASDGLGVVHHAMEGLNSVVKFASANAWIIAIVGGVAIYFLCGKWIKQRVARHMAGHPIFGSKGGA